MAISLNYTSFTSSSMAAKVVNAMTHVMATGESVRILNRNKLPFLLVVLSKDSLGYSFRFIDTEGRDVGHMILKAAVQGWSDEQGVAFWNLNSRAYDLEEHPLTTVAREEAAKDWADEHTADLLAQGVTHTVRLLGGKVLYGGYQRNWYGKRCLYLFSERTGSFHKATVEALAMVAWVEVLK